jgi:two-component system, LytTR family, sensor kinase
MVDHPFINSKRNILIYCIIWIIATVFTSIVNVKFAKFPVNYSIINSLVFNILFAILGLPIWFTVQYSNFEKLNLLSIILNHITSAAVLIFTWLGLGYLILTSLINDPKFFSPLLSEFIYSAIMSGVILYFIYVLIYYLIIYNRNLKEKKVTESILIAKVKEAELNLLKSQINPHFLFNSLNSISSLTITNPSKAQDMIIKLSDFLRYSIARDSKQKASLKAELENLQRYLEIEKIRFGDRLEYIPEISADCLRMTLPVMILQPLYENAIKHGVYESTEPIHLHVICSAEGTHLQINIHNNFDPEAPVRKGAGIGLKNISERLRLIYHSDGLLKTNKTKDMFEVRLLIPQIETI